MIRFFILLGLVIIGSHAQGQITTHERLEFEYDWRESDYLLIPNDELGVIMVQSETGKSGREYNFSLTQLDTALAQKWTDTLKIQKEFQLLGYHFVHEKTFLLFQETMGKSKVKIVRVNNKSGVIDEFESKELFELDIQEFEVIHNTAIIGGYYQSRPAVFAYDLENNKLRTLSNVYQNDSKLLEVRINKDSLTFNVLASQFNRVKDKTVLVNTYDYMGNPIRDYLLEVKPDYDLLSAISSSINDISQVVVGLYSYRSSTSPGGIYVNYIDRQGMQTMTYHGFGELEHFFTYLGEKKANRYKEKALKSKKQGKEVRYRIHPLFRELIEDDDQLVLFGEFVRGFNPSNDQFSNNSSGYGRPYNLYNPTSTFALPYSNDLNPNKTSEFNFTHAYVLVMDKKGNIQWDDWMEADYDMEGGLEEFGKFNWLGDFGIYTNYTDEEVHAKVMDGSTENEEMIDPLTLGKEQKVVKYEYENTLTTVAWYKNYFLIHGVQNVKNEDKTDDPRKVFFINKISVDKMKKAKTID